MKPKKLVLNLTKNQINKIKKLLLEPNDIKCDDEKVFSLIAEPSIHKKTLKIRLVSSYKDYNIITKCLDKVFKFK